MLYGAGRGIGYLVDVASGESIAEGGAAGLYKYLRWALEVEEELYTVLVGIRWCEVNFGVLGHPISCGVPTSAW